MEAWERAVRVELTAGRRPMPRSARLSMDRAVPTALASLLVACSASRHRGADADPIPVAPSATAVPVYYSPPSPPAPVVSPLAITHHWTSPTDGPCAGHEMLTPDDRTLIAELDAVSSDAGAPSDAGSAGAAMLDARGTVGNASIVVASMREGFRTCYNQLLRAQPFAEGRTRFVFIVNCNGTIIGIHAATRGLDAWILECMSATASRARFDPPHGGSAVVIVPVTFVRQTP